MSKPNDEHPDEGTRENPGVPHYILDAREPTTGDHAAAYSRLGLSVIRAYGVESGLCSCGRRSCNAVGKHPDVGGSWKPCGQTAAESNLIWEWFRNVPGANVAIICGAVSGILVVDADGAAGVAEAKLRGLPTTWIAQSGSGGLHAYFRHPGHPIGNRKLPGIGDLRADGGYVVAPPSLHASGGCYEWLSGLAPWEAKLAAPPEWLLRDLEKPKATPLIRKPSKTPSRLRKPNTEGSTLAPDLSRLPRKVRDLIRRGNHQEYDSRSEADMAVCVAMFRAGYHFNEVWHVMTDPDNGISEKYLDKGSRGDKYLELTISKAHDFYKSHRLRRSKVYATRKGRVSIV